MALAGESRSGGGSSHTSHMMCQKTRLLCPSPLPVEDFIRDAPERVGNLAFVAIAPLTNIAKTITKHPDLSNYVSRIIAMGTYLRSDFPRLRQRYGEGFSLDHNLRHDRRATEIVIGSGIPLVLVSADLTYLVYFDSKDFRTIINGAHGCCDEALKWLCHMFDSAHQNMACLNYLHDSLTVEIAMDNPFLQEVRSVEIYLRMGPGTLKYVEHSSISVVTKARLSDFRQDIMRCFLPHGSQN